MARARTVLPLLLLAASAWALVTLCSTSAFVGLRGAASAPQRAPVQARGGAGEIGMDEGTYIIGMSVLMIASVAANAAGFFGPW